jgi:hypothetical protein
MKQIEIGSIRFLEKIENLFDKENEFRVSIIGWQDGDYFKELCDEDGGVVDEHYQIFNNLPLSKKVNQYELNGIIKKFQDIPYLTSINGNYKFHYDLHIWSKKYYLVYNSNLQKLLIRKLKILDKIIAPVVRPSWQM